MLGSKDLCSYHGENQAATLQHDVSVRETTGYEHRYTGCTETGPVPKSLACSAHEPVYDAHIQGKQNKRCNINQGAGLPVQRLHRVRGGFECCEDNQAGEEYGFAD